MTVAERTATRQAGAGPAPADVSSEFERVFQPLLDEARARDGETLVSATIPVADLDPVALFAAARLRGAEPSLWCQPDSGFTLLALDAAWRVRVSGAARFETIEAAWAMLHENALLSGVDVARGTGPLLLGGLGFSAAPATSPAWVGFEVADLALPRLLVTVSPSGTWLTVSAVVAGPGTAMSSPDGEPPFNAAGAAATWQDSLRLMAAHPPSPATGDMLRVTSQRPEAPEWRATVARFAGAVGRGRLDKVVISRQVEVVAERAFDLGQLIERLAASAPDSTIFAITRGDRAFVGATPERLVELEGLEFRTLALAGSMRRAADPEGDAQLAASLLGSDKEREEHAVVVHMLRDTLAPVSASLTIQSEPGIRRLRHVQHLATEVSGSLRQPMGILSLVALLHPTPAVGGAPRDLALELIIEEERQERGWYAGPLGWLDRHGDGEFVVALRCGLIDGARATLFAGCGIVADSDPDREWHESTLKLRAFGSALGRFEA